MLYCMRVDFILGVLSIALSTLWIPRWVFFNFLRRLRSSIICLFVWFCSRPIDVLRCLGNGAWSNKVGIALSFNSLRNLIPSSLPLKWKNKNHSNIIFLTKQPVHVRSILVTCLIKMAEVIFFRKINLRSLLKHSCLKWSEQINNSFGSNFRLIFD